MRAVRLSWFSRLGLEVDQVSVGKDVFGVQRALHALQQRYTGWRHGLLHPVLAHLAHSVVVRQRAPAHTPTKLAYM